MIDLSLQRSVDALLISSILAYSSQIHIPDDVLYITIVTLFGLWGLRRPLLTREERMRQQAELDQANSGTPPDPMTIRNLSDPMIQPTALTAETTRSECLNYVKSLGQHYVTKTLVNHVARWSRDAIKDREQVDKLLPSKFASLSPQRFWFTDPTAIVQALAAAEMDEGGESEERSGPLPVMRSRRILDDLASVEKLLRHYTRALEVTSPGTRQDPWLDQATSTMLVSYSQYDQYLQIQARGNPAMIQAMVDLRVSLVSARQLTEASDAEELQEDSTHPQLESIPEAADNNDLVTTQDLQGSHLNDDADITLGMPFFDYFDVGEAYTLLGLEDGKWPNLNEDDPIYGSVDKPLKIQLRDHCCLGAAEVLARAFQTRAPGLSSVFKHNRGCIIGDGTGLGKTTQAIMMMAYLSYLAVKITKAYVAADREEKDVINEYPAVMFADRHYFRKCIRTYVDEWHLDASGSIRLRLRRARESGLDPFGSFGGGNNGSLKVPAKPSIVVMPPSLMDMWKTEIFRFAGAHTIVVEIVSPESSEGSLQPIIKASRAWSQAVSDGDSLEGLTAPSTFIVLISTNTLVRSHNWRTKRKANHQTPRTTVFSIEYGMLIFDECHLVKSRNKLQTATNRLSKRCMFTIGQTATPIINSPLDLCFIANALGFPQAEHVANGDEERMPRFFKRMRLTQGWERKIDLSNTTSWARDFYPHPESSDPDRRAAAFLSAPPTGKDRVAQVEASGKPGEGYIPLQFKTAFEDLKTTLGPYIMGRTKEAVNRKGERILPLGKVQHTVINVSLKPKEIQQFHEFLEESQTNRLVKWNMNGAYKK